MTEEELKRVYDENHISFTESIDESQLKKMNEEMLEKVKQDFFNISLFNQHSLVYDNTINRK